jgi:hypothetical protein
MITTALAVAAVASCSWDKPGHNPFMGNVPAAVQRYKDIPTPVRAALQKRMAARTYDDIVKITRDSIAGTHAYAPTVTGMHFGAGQVCGTVRRAKWTDRMQERGLVYCEAGHCVMVPTVCRNVSRITRLPGAPAAPIFSQDDAPGLITAGPAPAEEATPSAQIDLPPTSAGPLAPIVPPEPAQSGSFEEVAAGEQAPGVAPVWFSVTYPVLIPGPAALPPTSPVPEPGTSALLALGFAALSAAARKHRQRMA